jgi:general secretion pathway protein E
MFDNLFINPIYWLIAVAGTLAWARFTVFVGSDVHDRLQKQNELLWKLLPLGILLVMTFLWVLLPSFWLALPLNLLLCGGVVAWYWMIRVQELGPAGHLLSRAMMAMERTQKGMSERRAARAVMLTYIGQDEKPAPLPPPNDPQHAGMSYADQMLVQAMERRAGDIEFLPGAQGYDLRFVVDGVPVPQAPIPRNLAEPMIQGLKSLAGLSLEERRRPQEGAFKVRDAGGATTKWTVRSSGSTAGERLALAADEKNRWTFSLEQLGFSADQLAHVRQLAANNQGLVIVATPRGQGRTATLYTLLGMHDAFTNAVHSLETNPQAEIEGTTVHRFDPRAPEASYAKSLQSVFLKDPSIVLSAQCPDTASAEAIARFAIDEHRVYVGMPAFDTMAALEIWLKLLPDRALAVKALRAIISERLVRLLCPTCKTPYQPDAATLKRLNLPVGRNLQSFKANTEGLRDPKGNLIACPDCAGIGYRGRTGIFEVLVLTDEMRKELIAGASLKQIQASARKNNMSLLVESGIRKFAAGLTSINEVLRVVTPEKGTSPSEASGVHPAQR